MTQHNKKYIAKMMCLSIFVRKFWARLYFDTTVKTKMYFEGGDEIGKQVNQNSKDATPIRRNKCLPQSAWQKYISKKPTLKDIGESQLATI